MAKYKFEIKFPCGLRIKYSIKSWALNNYNDFDDIKECPLHGKKCPIRK